MNGNGEQPAQRHWLRDIRTSLDMTLEDVAHRISYTSGMVQKVEAGTRRPSRQFCERLASCLKIPDSKRAGFVNRLRGEGPQVPALPLLGSSTPRSSAPRLAAAALPGISQPSAIGAPKSHAGGLEAYFTDMEPHRDHFLGLVRAPHLSKRLLLLHGVGGIGKTSLLRMLQLRSLEEGVPAALTAPDEAASIPDLLRHWAEDLESQGVPTPLFSATADRYEHLQSAVNRHMSVEEKQADDDAAGTASHGTGHDLPGEQLPADRLYAFLGPADVELLLHPDSVFSSAFAEDIDAAADERRIVLMLDTFERIEILTQWLGRLALDMHPNVLMVVAGRSMPAWGEQWPGWLAHCYVQRLEPMTEEVMRLLVRNYYSTQLPEAGEPDPEQVESIIRFARGLPIVVTSAVQLWVKYGVADFSSVEPMVLSDLVAKLTDGISGRMRPVLEAASCVRWFSKPIMKALLEAIDAEATYAELSRFPFMRPNRQGLAVHDAMREIINLNLRMQDSERFRDLHARAARYFEQQMEQFQGVQMISEVWQQLAAERLYHLLQVAEDAGLDLFYALFMQAVEYFRYEFCRRIINDVEALQLSSQRSRYRIRYLRQRLVIAEYHQARGDNAELQELVADSYQDPALEWEVCLTYADYLFYQAHDEEGRLYLERALQVLQETDQLDSLAGCVVLSKLTSSSRESGVLKLDMALRALDLSLKLGGPYRQYHQYIEVGHIYLDEGNTGEALRMWTAALAVAQRMRNDALIADCLNRRAEALLMLGRLPEAEAATQKALKLSEQMPDTLGARQDKQKYIKRHMGRIYHLMGSYEKAARILEESTQGYRDSGSTNGLLRTLILQAECLYDAGKVAQVEALLPEIGSIVPRARALDFVARWHSLRANLLLDHAIEQSADERTLTEAMLAYKAASTMAQGWNVRAFGEVTDRIAGHLQALEDAGHCHLVIKLVTELLQSIRESTPQAGGAEARVGASARYQILLQQCLQKITVCHGKLSLQGAQDDTQSRSAK